MLWSCLTNRAGKGKNSASIKSLMIKNFKSILHFSDRSGLRKPSIYCAKSNTRWQKVKSLALWIFKRPECRCFLCNNKPSLILTSQKLNKKEEKSKQWNQSLKYCSRYSKGSSRISRKQRAPCRRLNSSICELNLTSLWSPSMETLTTTSWIKCPRSRGKSGSTTDPCQWSI